MRNLNSKVRLVSRTVERIELEVDGQTISVQVNHAQTPPTTYVWVNKGLVTELR